MWKKSVLGLPTVALQSLYNRNPNETPRASLSSLCGVMSEMVAAVLELKRCRTALKSVFGKYLRAEQSSHESVSYRSNGCVHLIVKAQVFGSREAYACTLNDAGWERWATVSVNIARQ